MGAFCEWMGLWKRGKAKFFSLAHRPEMLAEFRTPLTWEELWFLQQRAKRVGGKKERFTFLRAKTACSFVKWAFLRMSFGKEERFMFLRVEQNQRFCVRMVRTSVSNHEGKRDAFCIPLCGETHQCFGRTEWAILRMNGSVETLFGINIYPKRASPLLHLIKTTIM